MQELKLRRFYLRPKPTKVVKAHLDL